MDRSCGCMCPACTEKVTRSKGKVVYVDYTRRHCGGVYCKEVKR